MKYFDVSSKKTLQYRADIDGLRAIAVLAIIIFHINPKYLKSGFLGVDIFFVISGYLITSLLVKDISATGRLNLADFYRRRIQRIFPALLFMLIPTLLVGYNLMAPKDYAALSTSAIWALFSAANMYFYAAIDTGYFATGSDELPLLHLWSLGIEEQFYIVWPYLVALLIKSIQSITKQLLIIAAGLFVSLVLAQFLLSDHRADHQSFAYYLLPTRAWELMTGGIVAFILLSNRPVSQIVSEIVAALGLVLIVLGFTYISQDDAIPGIDAIPVVLGSACLLLSEDNTLVARALSLKPLVAIGLVSYSAYLWHWPILAFLRYALIPIDLSIVTEILVATFTMACISYFYVEHPLRQYKVGQKRVFVGYFSIPVLVIALSLGIVVQLINAKAAFLYPWNKYRTVGVDNKVSYNANYNCKSKNGYNIRQDMGPLGKCVFPDAVLPTALLVGDSHAAHYVGMLRLFSDHYNFPFRFATKSGCPPVFGAEELSWVNKKYAEGCTNYRAVIRAEFSKYDTVIIGGKWDVYNENGGKHFRSQLKRTLDILSHHVKHVIILANIPTFRGYNKECRIRRIRMPYLKCEKNLLADATVVETNNYLKRLIKYYSNVYLFDIHSQLCKENICQPYLNKKSVYNNSTHLSRVGSEQIGRKMLKDNDENLSVFEKINQLPR